MEPLSSFKKAVSYYGGHATLGVDYSDEFVMTFSAGVAAFVIAGGREVRFTDATFADSFSMQHDGTFFNFGAVNTTGLRLNDIPLYLEERAAAAGDTATLGQVWVRNDVPNILMYTDDTGVDSEVVMLESGLHLVLPSTNDAVTPTLAFGDGDSGFFENTDDSIYVSIAGSALYQMNAFNFGSVSLSRAGFRNQAPTTTVPTILPRSGDIDTGIGGNAVDEMSLIAGGVEFVRCVESTEDYMLVQVPMLIGESAAAVADIAAYGQVWVRDDVPNTLMFTDDAGTDFAIGGAAGRHQFVEQALDDTVNNTTTLIDSELLLTNIPIGRYSLLMVVNARDVAVSGCGMRTDISTTGVGGTSVLRGAVKNFSGSGAPTTDLQGILQDVMLFPSLSTGSGTDQIYYTGTLDVTSGTNSIQVEFAQSTAQVGDLDFEAGSFLALTKLD